MGERHVRLTEQRCGREAIQGQAPGRETEYICLIILWKAVVYLPCFTDIQAFSRCFVFCCPSGWCLFVDVIKLVFFLLFAWLLYVKVCLFSVFCLCSGGFKLFRLLLLER